MNRNARNLRRLTKALERAGYLVLVKKGCTMEAGIAEIRKAYLRICLRAEKLGWIKYPEKR